VLIVVRHGLTRANATGRLLGRLDVPLDPVGEEQATLLAAALAGSTDGIDRVISSPLQRTRQTAERLELPYEVDDRFIELDYGEYDGMPLAEVPPDVWRTWRSDPDFTPPGGESMSAMARRVAAALDDLAPAARTETIVVVSHVDHRPRHGRGAPVVQRDRSPATRVARKMTPPRGLTAGTDGARRNHLNRGW
jgi:broad specificity phosphatase PhoE